MESQTDNPLGSWQSVLSGSSSWLSARRAPRVSSSVSRYRISLGLILSTTLIVLLIPLLVSAAQSQTVESYLSEAKQLEEKQDYEGAISVYQQGLHALPDQPELLKRLGIVYQTELKFAESIQAFQKVLQLDPQYPEANFYMGLSYLGYNDFERALACFTRELKSHPDYRRAHLYAAKTLLALGRDGEAVQQYEALIQQNPKDARVWFELASLYRALAQHAYKQLASIDSDSFMLDILRAEADSDDLKYEDAVERYKQALKKQPDFPGLHFALGKVYFNMDRPLDAEPELRLALKEDPSNPPANYMLGRILLRNKKAQEALPFLQVAVNGDPTFMKGHLELGKCYLQLGEYPKALQALSKAAETDPQAPEPHVLLVQVYTRLKDDEKRTAELATVQKLERETQERVQQNVDRVVQRDK